MPVIRKKFTEQFIADVAAPKKGRVEFKDTLSQGLILRVTDNGNKSFSAIYKVKGEGGVTPEGRLLTGKQHRITLGKYPHLTLVKAREEAGKILTKAANGEDPRSELNEGNLHRFNNSYAAVQKLFIESYAKPNTKAWKNAEGYLTNHALPFFGNRPLSDIRRKDIHALIDKMVAATKKGAAQEVRKHLSKLFNWAIDREIITENPMFGLVRKDIKTSEDAGRALTDEELRAVWYAALQMGYPFGPMYQLLILTGQRKNEWASARINEINFEKRYLEIPRTRYKGKRDHIVPLADVVWDIVKDLPEWTAENYYLFTTRGGRIPVSGFGKAKDRLDMYALEKLCEMRNDPNTTLLRYRVHDFRVTCETRLANLGFYQEVRDRVLGHAQQGLQRTYNKHDYVEEKRKALTAYAQHIMEVVK